VISDDELLVMVLGAFADLGYEGTSVRALCRHLDVSHNLIHQRYGSKEELWYVAVDHGFRLMAAELLVEPDVVDDELELLRRVIRRYLVMVRARPALLRILHQEAARPGPRFDYMNERYLAPVQNLVEGLLGTLQEQGRIRAGQVGAVYYFLVTHGLGALGSLPALAEARGARGDDVLDLAVDVVVDGLLAR
jgi:AcrR family transcriptional regulator